MRDIIIVIKVYANTTLVRPQVEYAAAVWDRYTQENQHKIEMVQRRAAPPDTSVTTTPGMQVLSVTTMLHQLGWHNLRS